MLIADDVADLSEPMKKQLKASPIDGTKGTSGVRKVTSADACGITRKAHVSANPTKKSVLQNRGERERVETTPIGRRTR